MASLIFDLLSFHYTDLSEFNNFSFSLVVMGMICFFHYAHIYSESPHQPRAIITHERRWVNRVHSRRILPEGIKLI